MKPSDIFKCTKCGDCCKGYGGTYVTEKDIEAISDYIKTDPEHFVDNYCKVSGNKLVLAQGKNGYCIFWDDICTIHPVKPHMCRQWPFIKSILIDVNNWGIMANQCPGIRIDVPDSVVLECVKKKLSK
ncbi:MAG: YkgJ family cysteine cluster protein [Deltaproteobacteria bacterium]|nr:YkgJ family cysteine cluster protein [Deltaproteobacteria bacterium]MBW2661039.1 YkgJ family cysteine cluster protein [Deltaproteobacteria bacterium]